MTEALGTPSIWWRAKDGGRLLTRSVSRETLQYVTALPPTSAGVVKHQFTYAGNSEQLDFSVEIAPPDRSALQAPRRWNVFHDWVHTETKRSGALPSYNKWLRIDEAITDGLRCWPSNGPMGGAPDSLYVQDWLGPTPYINVASNRALSRNYMRARVLMSNEHRQRVAANSEADRNCVIASPFLPIPSTYMAAPLQLAAARPLHTSPTASSLANISPMNFNIFREGAASRLLSLVPGTAFQFAPPPANEHRLFYNTHRVPGESLEVPVTFGVCSVERANSSCAVTVGIVSLQATPFDGLRETHSRVSIAPGVKQSDGIHKAWPTDAAVPDYLAWNLLTERLSNVFLNLPEWFHIAPNFPPISEVSALYLQGGYIGGVWAYSHIDTYLRIPMPD